MNVHEKAQILCDDNGVPNIFLLLPPYIDSFVIRWYCHPIFTRNSKEGELLEAIVFKSYQHI